MPFRILVRFALLIASVVALTAASAWGQSPIDPDSNGVLRKPIPDRLIVLTFDDAPASHATVVAPILKSLGFGGSFYVCNFDSFSTRKDWYLTYRQMVALDKDGFEIGNHTHGHGGGLENYLRMEDEVLANHGPKMTTVCWPVYQVVWPICPNLAAHGYTFGRGGHQRPYRPTVDNPFDVPSFSITDGTPIENFTKQVQQASQGRVVVLTFHGVPDMEHPPVSLEPATFKAMMQYLKDNNYQCIALRDLAKYIDPAKAANLPRTANDGKDAPPLNRLQDDKPFVAPAAKDIREFRFPNLPPANISNTGVQLTVPYATDVTALASNIKVSAAATVAPASGTSRDFSQPQTYTVTARDGSTKSYVVTVNKATVSAAKELLTFTLPGAHAAAVSRNRISVYVPASTDLKVLVPTFTLSPFATAVPASGTPRDFTQPQTYQITAQDESSQTVTVTVVKRDMPNAFTWSKPEGGMNIKTFLTERNVPFEVLAHSWTTGAARVAESVHVSGGSFAKTVLLRVNHGYRDVVALVPANLRIDPDKVSQMLRGAEIRMGTEDDVAVHCPDCERGVLPPFGSQYGMQTMVDVALAEGDDLVFESNTHDEAVRIRWVDYVRLEQPQVAPLAMTSHGTIQGAT